VAVADAMTHVQASKLGASLQRNEVALLDLVIIRIRTLTVQMRIRFSGW